MFEDDRTLYGERFYSLKEYFLPYLGPVHKVPPVHGYLSSIEAKHSDLDHTPFYIPANWKIKHIDEPVGSDSTFRLKVRLFPHGGCSIALSSQLHWENGLRLEDFITFMQSFIGYEHSEELRLNVQNSIQTLTLNPIQVLDLALEYTWKGLFKNSLDQDDPDALITFEPDHILIDLVKSNPSPEHGKHDKEMTGLLRLNPNWSRLSPIKQAEDLGIYENDWILHNNRCLLFSQNMTYWPRKDKIQWSKRRRARLGWHFFKVVEFVRLEKLALDYITNKFEQMTLQMRRSKNKTLPFLKHLFKISFYDDTLVTFASDLPTLNEHIWGQLNKLYLHLAANANTEKSRKRFEKSQDEFLSQVDSWHPGVKKLIDIAKLIPLP